ncbi:hypothetical protein G7Z17_g6029 [Cylindrodendrum hubeiense]|uniref:Heterokaryon incompatibility domain-containing protein n=1 Tax=Cylindrodendrum hubeiense TaxID=595255 RepID=A0A9P5HFY2_9HYPO|nr:hypothetical protein G7Z17_g6029 [Cylindrodendrum hubeiense]
MRLLHTKEAKLCEFQANWPPYAILSHRWGDEEVTLQDVQALRGSWAALDDDEENALITSKITSKKGFNKLAKSAELARRNGFDYIWADTCCIDKTNSAELTEAINSMYQWYEAADVCYAYLVDVKPAFEEDMHTHSSSFRESHWFRRGWTLQELIAPSDVEFFACDWSYLGNKRETNRFTELLKDITHIPNAVLQGETHPSEASVASRMSWASTRETTRVEDLAYCLLGLFDVNMPPLYGEGEKAFTRLQEQILAQNDDESIFAWHTEEPSDGTFYGLLAERPSYFRNSHDLEPASRLTLGERGVMTSKGLKIDFSLHRCTDTPGADCFVILYCKPPGDLEQDSPVIYLKRIWVDEFARVFPHKVVSRRFRSVENETETVFVKQKPSRKSQFIRIIAEKMNVATAYSPRWVILDVYPRSGWSESAIELMPSDFRIGQAFALLRIQVDERGTIDVAVGLKLHNGRQIRSWCTQFRSDSAAWNPEDNFWVINQLLRQKEDLEGLTSKSIEDINGREMPISVTVVERHGVRNLDLVLSIERRSSPENGFQAEKGMDDDLPAQEASTLQVDASGNTSIAPCVQRNPHRPLWALSFPIQRIDLDPVKGMMELENIYLPQEMPGDAYFWSSGVPRSDMLYMCLKRQSFPSPPPGSFHELCYKGDLTEDLFSPESDVAIRMNRDTWIGLTPFAWALAGNNMDEAMFLLNHNPYQLAKLAYGGFSAVHVAAGLGQSVVICDMVKFIMNDESLVTKYMGDDPTAVFIAASESTQDTPLHTAAAYATNLTFWQWLDTMAWSLLVSRLRVPRNKWGATPLHLAALTGNLAAACAILTFWRSNTGEMDEEADMCYDRAHSVDDMGRSCAWYAAYSDSPDIIGWLCLESPPLDLADENGFAPIHVACCLGNVSGLSKLLERGANINVPTSDLLLLPSHIAAIYGKLECLKVLVEQEARLDWGDDADTPPFTAITLAVANGHLECARMLWDAHHVPVSGVVACVVIRNQGTFIEHLDITINGDEFQIETLIHEESRVAPPPIPVNQEPDEPARHHRTGRSWLPWNSSKRI